MDNFDEEFYLDLYPDVKDAVDNGVFGSGEEHFLQVGQGEGRLGAPANVIDFEGYVNFQPIGTVGGISFSDNALALVDTDAEGEGNFGDNPSGDTIAAYADGDSITLTLTSGPVTGGILSFHYSSPNRSHEVVFLDSSGAVVDRQPLEATSGELNQFTDWQREILRFDGNVSRIRLGSAATQIGFDDISIDSETTVTTTIQGNVWDDRNGNGTRDRRLRIVGNPPDILFVIDISDSTRDPFIGTPVGDVNGDGDPNTIFDAELAAVRALNQELIDQGLGNTARIGIVVFDDVASALDMDPATSGVQLITNPATDNDGNGIADVEDLLLSLRSGENTNFEDALQESLNTLTSLGTAPGNGNVIFMSDGANNRGGSFDDEVNDLLGLNTNLRAFGVGASANLAQLQQIDPSAQIFTTTNELLDVFVGVGGTTTTTADEEPGFPGVTVYLDLNDNGVLDGGEPNIISQADDPGTPDVDETGNYAFPGVQPGSYTVRQLVPAGFTQSFPLGTPAPGPHQVTIAPGETLNLNFGNTNNQPPIAQDDTASAIGSIPTTIAVLDNDSDPDGDEVAVINFAAISDNGGTISQDAEQLLYVAPSGFAGTDSFIYTISDGRRAQDTATVTVTVVNPLVAVGDTAATSSGASVTIDVLANDFDVDGTAELADFPTTTANGGAISRADNGTPEDPTDDLLSYSPPDGFTGADSFTYTVRDDRGLSATATVSVTVNVGNGSISGTKFQDDNGNGVQDSDENVSEGVTIFLDNNDDGQLSEDEQSVVTDADGNYSFTDLEPGTYIVREVVPDGFSQTFPGGGGLVGDGFADVVLEYFDSGAGPIAGPYGRIGSNFPIPVSLDVVLGDESQVSDSLSLPTGSFVTVGFTDEAVVDGPGDDIFIQELAPAGEQAEVLVSSNFEDFTPLGIADDGVTTSFDLADIGFTEPVRAVRIVGLDDRGGSPGFDVVNVQVLPQSLGSGNYVVTIDAGENVEDLDFGNIANQSPVAVDDAGVITDADTPVTIDVLSNDFDPDGNPISLISFGFITANGRTVSRDDNNTPDDLTDDSLIYSPPEDFAGTDTITYTISDGLGGADIGNVNITVASDNLLVNGSFEEGPPIDPSGCSPLSVGSTDIVGWVVTRGSIDYKGTLWEASDGTGSIDLDGTEFGGIAQTFSTIPGQDYLVTFDLAGNPSRQPTIKQMRVGAAGQSADFSFDVTGSSLSNMGWEAQSWQFTAVDTSTTIEFLSLNTEGGAWGAAIDNVSVVATTPPEQPLDLAGEWQYSSPEDFTILSTGFSDGAPAFAAPLEIIQNGNQVTITGFYLNSTGSGTGVISGNNITATLPIAGGTGELVGTISANGRIISGTITFSDGEAENSTAIIDFTMTSQQDGGNDIIDGDAGDNLLTADVGDDFISGLAGNDRLDGGAGNDTLDSGASTITVETPDELDFSVTEFPVGDAPIDLVAANLSINILGVQVEDLFIITANSGSNDLSLLQSNGDGSFTNLALPLAFPDGVTASSLRSADEDADGNADFLVGTNIENNTIVGVRTTLETFEFPVGDSPVSVALADFNGDGNIDGATANSGDDTVTILSNINNENVTTDNIDVGTAPSYITAADIDGDEDQDLIVVNNGFGSISVLRNDGVGNFQMTSESAVGNSPVWVTAADLNGDDAIDLAVANSEDDSISLLLNNGSGSFSQAGTIQVGSNPVSLTAADLDGDSDIDLAVVNSDDNNVSVWRNNGNASFDPSVTVTVGSNPVSVTAADLDEDGDIDLAVANEDSDDVSLILNNGLVPVSDGEGDGEGDTVTGGAGSDSFVLNGPADGFDIITDFVPDSDTLLLSQDVFGDAFTLGTLDETQFTLSTAATTPDQQFIYDISTGTLFFDADGDGPIAQVQLAILTADIEISAADILVVETVTAPNRSPVAADDRATIAQNSTGTIDVLTNDFDLDGDPISLTGFEETSANGGNVTRNDDRLVYTPATDFTGTDSFSYSISDGRETDTGTVTLSVGQASPPDPDDGGPTSDLSVTASVSNSTPDEGEAIAYSIEVSGQSAARDIELRSQLPAGLNLQYTTTSLGVYDPNTGIWRISTLPAGRTATLELNVEVGSGIVGETLVNEVEVISPSGVDNQGTVPITISGDNQAPIATDDELTTDLGMPVAIEVLENDSDPDGTPLEVTGVGVAENGDASIISNQVIYRPDAEFAGVDSFVYTISDGRGGTSTATVTVTVAPENQDPNAVPDNAIASVGQTISIDVLANDFDLDEDPIGLAAFRRQTAAGGTVVRNNNGTRNRRDDFLEYTPAAGFTGTDSFAYRIRDGRGGTDTARVTVNVTPVAEFNGSISGTTFADANSNGIQDPAEGGIAGFTIFLDSDSNSFLDPGEISVVTGANGNYFFGDLPASSYNVQAVPQSDFDFSSSSSNPVIVVLAQGEDRSGVNFGYLGGSTTVEDISILGSTDDDDLVAGAGNDNLTGDLGNDTLTGGTGSDLFIFNSPDEALDLITDFEVFSDAIGVSSAGFGGGLIPGNLDPDRFTLGTAATTPDQRFIYGNDGSLFFDADGTGAIGQVQIATLSGGPGEFSASDIIVL